MTVEDVPGRVTICSRGKSSLSADEAGVTLREYPRRPRLIPWSEISRFADGYQMDGDPPFPRWVLQIVLRSGNSCKVRCTMGSGPETLVAIRQVAERYRISANLSGIYIKDGRPLGKGLFTDPGGQPGVRYWDGSRWSPLLAPISGRWRSPAR